MARCYCRWWNALVCVCMPCICLALLFIYISAMVCLNINTRVLHGTRVHGIEHVHFVASGTFTNDSFASMPKTFWKLHEDALWNKLQLDVDRHFNPILLPQHHKTRLESKRIFNSLLKLSFSGGAGSDSMSRNFDKLPQQMQRFVSHMMRRDYPVLIQPDGTCGAGARDEKEPSLLLLAIKTSELNFRNRQAIRQTWGQVGWAAGQQRKSRGGGGGYIRRVFLLGKESPEELSVDIVQLLQKEAKEYGDILQWDFSDTFFNLTLKDVLFWGWFSCYCSHTRFVFKGDDDVFVHTPNMITYLQDQVRLPEAKGTMEEFMVGDVISAAAPNRVYESKYFIPDSFYKGLYPSYAGGGGVLYSGLLAQRLNQISRRVHLFPIDDVFVGMCMARLDAYPIHHPAFLSFDFAKNEEDGPCVYHTIIMVHKRSPSQMVQLWADMKNTQTQCWDVALRAADKKGSESAMNGRFKDYSSRA
ncbi:N-acetyllactosaminide beta-1,3-N-acetylglucosaminyltransferase 2-like [Aulostomus maculatus]